MITAQCTVRAPVEDVWTSLVDLDGYPSWNPFITSASGSVDVGQRLELTMQLPGSQARRFTPWVTAVEPGRYLEWLGCPGLPGVFDGRHSFSLTPLSVARTLVQQAGTFNGLLVPFAPAILVRTRAGFEAMNATLAWRALQHAP